MTSLSERSGVLALSPEQVSSGVADAIVREAGRILERLRFEGNLEVRISLTLGRAIYDALSAQEGAHLLHPPIDPGFDLYHPSGIYLGDDRRNSTPLCLDETLDPYAIGWTVLPN